MSLFVFCVSSLEFHLYQCFCQSTENEMSEGIMFHEMESDCAYG